MSHVSHPKSSGPWLRDHRDHLVTALLVTIFVAVIVFLWMSPGTSPDVRMW